MTDEFELDDNGNINAVPLLLYKTASVAGVCAILRLDYAANKMEYETGKWQSLQLTMTPNQCRELAEALLQVEETLLGQTVSTQAN